MSSRRGNVASQEAVEQVQAVVRAGAGLGVVLDGAAGHVEQLEALDGAVVEVDVRERGGAEVRLPAHRLVAVDRARAAGPEGREAVVLRGDLDAPGLQVRDGMVGAVVAEGQLEGLEADRAAQQLVAEADAPHGLDADELADGLHDVGQRRRVAGAVGQEDRVGILGEQLLGAGSCTGAATRAPRAPRARAPSMP